MKPLKGKRKRMKTQNKQLIKIFKNIENHIKF